MAGLAAAAAVVAVIVGMLAVTRDTDTVPPISPSPSPTPSKTHSPQTWVDATMTPVEDNGRTATSTFRRRPHLETGTS